MNSKLRKIIKYMIIILSFLLVMQIVGLLGVFGGTDSCFFRYNFDNNGGGNAYINGGVSERISLNANGYYDSKDDPKSKSSYGKWKKSSVFF